MKREAIRKNHSSVGTKSLLSLSFDMAKMGSNKNQMVTKMTFLVR